MRGPSDKGCKRGLLNPVALDAETPASTGQVGGRAILEYAGEAIPSILVTQEEVGTVIF